MPFSENSGCKRPGIALQPGAGNFEVGDRGTFGVTVYLFLLQQTNLLRGRPTLTVVSGPFRRADLGLFGFPGKEIQYRFLSQFLPVFYIRTRDYSKV